MSWFRRRIQPAKSNPPEAVEVDGAHAEPVDPDAPESEQKEAIKKRIHDVRSRLHYLEVRAAVELARKAEHKGG